MDIIAIPKCFFAVGRVVGTGGVAKESEQSISCVAFRPSCFFLLLPPFSAIMGITILSPVVEDIRRPASNELDADGDVDMDQLPTKRPRLAKFHNSPGTRDPVSTFAVDQMADYAESRPGLSPFVALGPVLRQVAQERVECRRRAGKKRDRLI